MCHIPILPPTFLASCWCPWWSCGIRGDRWERHVFLGTVVERAKILRGWSALRVPWPLFKATVDLSHPLINNVILRPKKASWCTLVAYTRGVNNARAIDRWWTVSHANGSYGNGLETTPVMRLKQNVPRRLIYTALIPVSILSTEVERFWYMFRKAWRR